MLTTRCTANKDRSDSSVDALESSGVDEPLRGLKARFQRVERVEQQIDCSACTCPCLSRGRGVRINWYFTIRSLLGLGTTDHEGLNEGWVGIASPGVGHGQESASRSLMKVGECRRLRLEFPRDQTLGIFD